MHPWLLTSTTYGTWLPGDPRGSVTSVRERRAGDPTTHRRLEHSVYGTAWEPPLAGLARAATAALRSAPVLLTAAQADVLTAQLDETARFRNWRLRAVAVMANHFHLIVLLGDGVAPRKALSDFKAYGSRALNASFGHRDRWWTSGGSTRWLRNRRALENGVRYVLEKQPNPLVTWSADDL